MPNGVRMSKRDADKLLKKHSDQTMNRSPDAAKRIKRLENRVKMLETAVRVLQEQIEPGFAEYLRQKMREAYDD